MFLLFAALVQSLFFGGLVTEADGIQPGICCIMEHLLGGDDLLELCCFFLAVFGRVLYISSTYLSSPSHLRMGCRILVAHHKPLLGGHGYIAVSYTHLTLPTIYSV